MLKNFFNYSRSLAKRTLQPMRDQMKLKELLTESAQAKHVCSKNSKQILFNILSKRKWKDL